MHSNSDTAAIGATGSGSGPADTAETGKLALCAQGVRKAFKIGSREIEVLHGAHIDLRRGERLCLMGASGAGKSTFLHVLGLLEEPTEGQVFLQGKSAWDLSMAERAALRNRYIGFVFQAYHLLPDLSALENVVLPLRIAHSYGSLRFNKQQHTQEAAELLDKFGLGDRLKHRPNQLSGGEKQRVSVARALILGPDILIADEPTGNLDTGTGERVLDLILDEQRQRSLSLLLVTHDERLSRRCDRTVIMEDGQIQADSEVEMPQ